MFLDRQRYTVFWPYTICRPNTKTKISRTRGHTTHRHTRTDFFFGMYQLETRFARTRIQDIGSVLLAQLTSLRDEQRALVSCLALIALCLRGLFDGYGQERAHTH